MMYTIGLTGNIACGKSTVSALFKDLGAGIIDADAIGKQLTQPGTSAYNKIIQHFDTCIIKNDNQLDRKLLRDLIFNDPKERLWLEQLLHPKIAQQIKHELNNLDALYCLIEIPLLKNKSNYPFLNHILLVDTPNDLQLRRLIHRDKCTNLQAQAIISTQPSRKERLNLADKILNNDGDIEQLKQQVICLHQLYSALSKSYKL